VPVYVHPAAAPDLWRRVVDAAPVLRAVIVNPASGPGTEVDPSYPPVVERLRAAGVRLVGYVDTDYGRRPLRLIQADLTAYRDFYGIRDAFFDQVTIGLDALGHYADVALRARAAGARLVVFNPGAPPHPAYLGLADVVVSFEGRWQDYQGMGWPVLQRSVQYRSVLQPSVQYRSVLQPSVLHRSVLHRLRLQRFGASADVAGRLCHLVYGLPRDAGASEAFGELLRRAAAAGVGTVFASDGSGGNPWTTFPKRLVHDLMEAAPIGPVVPQPGDRPPGATERG
jgi:hypothetical protein